MLKDYIKVLKTAFFGNSVFLFGCYWSFVCATIFSVCFLRLLSGGLWFRVCLVVEAFFYAACTRF